MILQLKKWIPVSVWRSYGQECGGSLFTHSAVFGHWLNLGKVTPRRRASTSTRWNFAFTLCCHSNETRSSIANPPNSAQLGAPPTIPPSYIRVRAVVWACGDGQTHKQTRMTNIHFASSTTHAKCNRTYLLLNSVVVFMMFLWRYFLWPPCVADAVIIFLPCGFFLLLSFFFPRLISAVPDGCLQYFHTWCGLSANLGCWSETCCARLDENIGRKKSP